MSISARLKRRRTEMWIDDPHCENCGLVNKASLISKIKENKLAHQKQYAEAVIAYRKEAAEQLAEQQKKLAAGDLDLRINIVTPVDKSDEYDKVVTMFEWEVEDKVTLSQDEFNEYVLDEVGFAVQARVSNTMYLQEFQ